MNKRTKNTGITIISLVITIIIMLILVGVSITLAVNGGLFNYAGKAVGETQKAIDQEQELINDLINNHIKPNTKKDNTSGNEGTTDSSKEETLTAPSLAVTSGTEGNNGWYTSDVTVTITSENTENETVCYSVNGAQTVSETQGTSVTITEEGVSTITAYTCNNEGERSKATIITIKKDSIAPTFTLSGYLIHQASSTFAFAFEYDELLDEISGIPDDACFEFYAGEFRSDISNRSIYF